MTAIARAVSSGLSLRGWMLAGVFATTLHASVIAPAFLQPVETPVEDEADGLAAPIDIVALAAVPEEVATRSGQSTPEIAPQLASPTATPVEPPPEAEKNDIQIEQRSMEQAKVAMPMPSKEESKEKTETTEEQPPTPPQPDATAAAAAQDAASTPTVSAPVAAEARAVSLGLTPSARKSKATWQKALVTHIDKFKRYPEAARAKSSTGEVLVAFTMNRAGDVLTHRIIAGSDTSALDEEALAILTRAKPLPVPPSDVAGELFELAVPIRFKLK